MITNENDFIGILMKCKDDNGICKTSNVVKSSKMTDLQCLPFIKSLSDKEVIKRIDLDHIQINPIAYSLYESPKKKVGKLFLKLSVSALKFIITYVLGIISGLAIAYFANKFGWQ